MQTLPPLPLKAVVVILGLLHVRSFLNVDEVGSRPWKGKNFLPWGFEAEDESPQAQGTLAVVC